MKKIFRQLLIALAFIALEFAVVCRASDYWWTNTAGWNSTGYGAGDTIHLVGTNTATGTLTNGGAIGNPLTIHFEPGAEFITQSNQFLELGTNNNIIVDGGGYGVLQCTNNGTGLAAHLGINGIAAEPSVGNLTIENLSIPSLYIRTNSTDTNIGLAGAAIYIHPAGSCSNVTIVNTHITNACYAILYSLPGSATNRDITISSNASYGINQSVVVGDVAGGAICSNLVCNANTGGHFGVWNDSINNATHHNLFHDYANQSGSYFMDERVYGNLCLIDDAQSGTYQTAGIFDEGTAISSHRNPWYYNNIIQATNGGISGGAFEISDMTNGVVANNTCYAANNLSSALEVSGASVTNTLFVNNLCIGFVNPVVNNTPTWYLNNTNSFYSDYNAFYPATGGKIGWDGTNVSEPFSFWTGAGQPIHNDNHSLNTNAVVPLATGNPLVDFALTNSVLAQSRGVGTNLTAYFTTDYLGNTRTNAGGWDIGALAYTTVNQNTNPPTYITIQATVRATISWH